MNVDTAINYLSSEISGLSRGNYPFNEIVVDSSAASVQLADKAVNILVVDESPESRVQVGFPDSFGLARDFFVRIELSPGVADPFSWPVDDISIETPDGEFPEITAGSTTILYFTETRPGTFLVKSEYPHSI